jgi:hypothetical protein
MTPLDWHPCDNCQRRLSLENRREQEHASELERIEILDESRGFDGKPDSWSLLERLKCTDCLLEWTRSQIQGGVLMQYESEFTPQPTGAQAAALPPN